MSTRARAAGLPVAALALVAGVLGVQVANGGGSFAPLQPADPCVDRSVTSRAGGIDGLSERLVLIGLDEAACRLGRTREDLTLELARGGARTDAEVAAFRAGLLAAVDRMAEDGTLPAASELLDEALDQADLNAFLEVAIRALPDAVVDAALSTEDVLRRAVEDLDLRALLADLDDQAELDRQVEAAVTQAVEDALVDRLGDLV